MNVFLFSSPWKYYMENLLPVAQEFIKQGHNVTMSYFLGRVNHKTEEIFKAKHANGGFYNFISENYNPDVVILTQPWWEYEKEIVKVCKSKGIPFFILEHSPQMLLYNKKAANYRKDIMGAKAHIMWGDISRDIMAKLGANAELPVLGSPRIETALESANSKKNNTAIFYSTSSNYSSKNLLKKITYLNNLFKDNNYNFIFQAHSRFHKNNETYKYIKKEKIPFFQNLESKKSLDIMSSSSINIYDFPSSLMIASAALENDMYCTYEGSEIKEVKEYYKKNEKIIKSINKIDFNSLKIPDYNLFLKENISMKDEKSSYRVYKYIMESI